jgi:excisionase family DNA binding protein
MSILKVLRERAEPLNVSELATMLKVTETTVQRWVRKRQIPSIRIGDVIRFDGAMLADWIEGEAGCAHPRTPENPEDHEIRWQDLGQLAPEDVPSAVNRQQTEKS